VSEREARVEGLMLKPWNELMNTLGPVVENELVFIVVAVNPPGDSEKQTCRELTRLIGKPYAAVSGPVRMKLEGFEGITPGLGYQSSYYGPINP